MRLFAYYKNTMASKVFIWKNLPGIAERYNDILYKCPLTSATKDFLLYFGGDVQDIQENMKKHSDSRQYIEWCLENTAEILSEHFPKNHILIIRPSRMSMTKHAVFSCYDNFVPGDNYGIPTFCATYNALKHLQELVKSSLKQITKLEKMEVMSRCNINEMNLTLMGFSKGCVVLNQLLHEFYYFHTKSEDVEINNFISSIKNMWWLDGGHGGCKDTWITDTHLLESLANLKVNVHVHVTPYQVQDKNRPWIRDEETCFYHTLCGLGVTVKHTLHFDNKPRSLVSHFNVLKAIGGNV